MAKNIKAARAEMRKAQTKLNANARHERAHGIRDETARYVHLNKAVSDAAAKLPWWAR